MGLIDKLKRAGSDDRDGDEKSSEPAGASEDEGLPGGSSGQEAAEVPPERAAELAD